MKCDRETSHHCRGPISQLPHFWSSKKIGLWSVQGQSGSLLRSQNACGCLCKMLITLLLAVQLSVSMSDWEWLSHCGVLYHFPGAATGTKGGSSCRFKKDVFSTACEVAVRIIFLFSFICAVIENLLQMRYQEQCCQSIQLSARGKKCSPLSCRASAPVTVLKSQFIFPCVCQFLVKHLN